MSNTIIEVKCDSDTQLYFRKAGDNTWSQLTSSSSQAPVLSVTSEKTITFEFVKYSGSSFDVFFKQSESVLPTSNGPTLPVTSGAREETNFAKNDSTPNYYAGYVAVNEDAR